MFRARSLILRTMLVCVCALGAAAADPPTAQPDENGAAEELIDDLVSVRLATDVPHVQPGRTFHLAVVFRIQEHWHIYWKNPGTGGLATEVSVTAPKGYRVGPVMFPRPKRYQDGREISFGYEDETVLFVPITAPRIIDAESAKFDCQISWLVCRSSCVLGSADQSITVPIRAASEEESAAKRDPVLVKHFKRLPRPLKDLKGSRIAIEGDHLTITGPMPGFNQVAFFPAYRPGVTLGEAEIKSGDDRFSIHVPLTITPADSLGEPPAVGGLIALGDHDDDPCYEFTLSLEEKPVGSQTQDE